MRILATGSNCLPKAGIGAVPEQMVAALPSDCQVVLQQRVDKVRAPQPRTRCMVLFNPLLFKYASRVLSTRIPSLHTRQVLPPHLVAAGVVRRNALADCSASAAFSGPTHASTTLCTPADSAAGGSTSQHCLTPLPAAPPALSSPRAPTLPHTPLHSASRRW